MCGRCDVGESRARVARMVYYVLAREKKANPAHGAFRAASNLKVIENRIAALAPKEAPPGLVSRFKTNQKSALCSGS